VTVRDFGDEFYRGSSKTDEFLPDCTVSHTAKTAFFILAAVRDGEVCTIQGRYLLRDGEDYALYRIVIYCVTVKTMHSWGRYLLREDEVYAIQGRYLCAPR